MAILRFKIGDRKFEYIGQPHEIHRLIYKILRGQAKLKAEEGE